MKVLLFIILISGRTWGSCVSYTTPFLEIPPSEIIQRFLNLAKFDPPEKFAKEFWGKLNLARGKEELEQAIRERAITAFEKRNFTETNHLFHFVSVINPDHKDNIPLNLLVALGLNDRALTEGLLLKIFQNGHKSYLQSYAAIRATLITNPPMAFHLAKEGYYKWPNDQVLLALLVRSALVNGKRKLATEKTNELIDRFPSYSLTHFYAAKIANFSGDRLNELNHLKKAFMSDNSNPEITHDLFLSYVANRQYQDGVWLSTILLEEDFNDPDIILTLYSAYFRVKGPEVARKILVPKLEGKNVLLPQWLKKALYY